MRSIETIIPQVSINMICRNEEQLIHQAIESIIHQTFSHWELIVVDDGSTDRTRKIVASYAAEDLRIKLYTQKPLGRPQARNHALRVSKGEYLAIMDADDVSHPDRLAKQVAFLDAHPDHAMISTQIWFCQKNLTPVLKSNFPLNDEEYQMIRNIPNCQTPPYGCAMFRRNVFEEVGEYNKKLSRAQDYDLTLRIRKYTKHKIAALPEALYYYRIDSRLFRFWHQYLRGCQLRRFVWTRNFGNLSEKASFRSYLNRGEFMNWYYRLYYFCRHTLGFFKNKWRFGA